LSSRRAIRIVAIAAAALLTVLWVQRRRDPSSRTFRIGFEESGPDQGIGPNGEAIGPAVEVVQEAARCRNIRLKWVYMPGGPGPAMSSGAAGLRGPRILAAEDNVVNQRVLCLMPERRGCIAEAACKGNDSDGLPNAGNGRLRGYPPRCAQRWGTAPRRSSPSPPGP